MRGGMTPRLAMLIVILVGRAAADRQFGGNLSDTLLFPTLQV